MYVCRKKASWCKLVKFSLFCRVLLMLLTILQCWLWNILCKLWHESMLKGLCTQPLRHCQLTFSSSLMVSFRVSALGRTDLHFIDAGMKLKQDSAPAHCAKEMVNLLKRETPHQNQTSSHTLSPDLNRVDYKFARYGTSFSSEFTAGKSKMWMSCYKWDQCVTDNTVKQWCSTSSHLCGC